MARDKGNQHLLYKLTIGPQFNTILLNMTDSKPVHPGHFYMPFASNLAGFIIPMVTGFLSAVSSGLILYVILKSEVKLYTTHHRIMAYMSFFDIISSVFIALGTIMVPSDCIYKLAGPLLGNPVTCQIQGWLIVFGVSGSMAMYACLLWYFVLRITFKMDMHKMERYIEPVVFFYSTFCSILFPSFLLSRDLIHPNAYDSFCTTAPYPDSCDETYWYDWNFCTWGEGVMDNYTRSILLIHIGFLIQFVLIVLGILMILWTVRRNMKDINDLLAKEEQKYGEDSSLEATGERIRSNRKNEQVDDLKYLRVMIYQALMYIFAFFVTWILNALSGSFNIANFELDAISCILFPLQGFWNLLIFLYDKTYIIHQIDDNIGFLQACKKIILMPRDTPVFVFSDISAVGNLSQSQDISNKDSHGNDDNYRDRQQPDFGNLKVSPAHSNVSDTLRREDFRRSVFHSKIRRVGMMVQRGGDHRSRSSSPSSVSIESPIGFVSNSISS
jgi:hypothetical protein